MRSVTPKDKNEWKFGILIFAPMIGIPVLFALVGILNIATGFLGAMLGITLGQIGLITGFVKNRVV